MNESPRMSLADMATKAESQTRLTCSGCGCHDFRTYKTIPGHLDTFRYKQCRHCGKKILTAQSPERAVRDVETQGELFEGED